MSTPAQQQAAQQPAQQQPAQQQKPPGQGPRPAAKPSAVSRVKAAAAGSSTPARIRWARGLATIAAALSGLVATGSFDTDGLNATPNVIAQQWAAAEWAGVQIAQGDAAAVEGLAAATAGTEATDTPAQWFGEAAGWHARSGAVGEDQAGRVAEALTSAAVLTDQAQRQAADDPAAAMETYGAARDQIRSAAAANGQIVEQRTTELQTGSRSVLTATVGGAATLILVLVMVWLALRTRRIINVPLLVATLITAGLTYLSFNPSALPVNYDQRVNEASRSASALRQTYEARWAQYATVLGIDGANYDPAGNAAQRAINATGDSTARDAWRAVDDALTELPTDDVAAGVSAIEATADDYEAAVGSLTSRLDLALSDAGSRIGTPASITSGGALLLGLIAAGLAWAGLTQRLRDYR